MIEPNDRLDDEELTHAFGVFQVMVRLNLKERKISAKYKKKKERSTHIRSECLAGRVRTD